jgi:hypothetical protein
VQGVPEEPPEKEQKISSQSIFPIAGKLPIPKF